MHQTFKNSPRRPHFGSIFLTSLVLLLALPIPYARGENAARKEPLSEAQLLHLLPVLRAYAASLKQTANPTDSLSGNAGRLLDSRVGLITDIKEGRVDPLEWIQAHSGFAFVPPMLEYDDRCSRLASELAVRPVAVFTFGIEASELGSALLADDRKEIQKILNDGRDQSDSQQRVNAAVANARAYYQKKKYGNFLRDSTLSWTIISPDSLLQVSVSEVNVYLHWGETRLPSGPLLELSWNRGPEDSADEDDSALAQSLPSLLKKAKVNEQDFLSFTTALVVARRDAQDPGKLEIDKNYIPATDADKRLYEDLNRIVTVRKQNMALYLRYARILDPLLETFEAQ